MLHKLGFCWCGTAHVRLADIPNRRFIHFPKDMPSTECACGGFIAWQDYGDEWSGSCYGKCAGYPTVHKGT
jgi:hypothetical protein